MDDNAIATWHFFQRSNESELWCAVPAHEALPPFLLSGDWHFSGHQFGPRRTPPGFDQAAAGVAERFNGFYLFQLTNEADGYSAKSV